MTKKEWVEYFQAVNGRDPLPLEFLEAKRNGEFDAEMPQQDSMSNPVEEEISSEVVSLEIVQQTNNSSVDNTIIDSAKAEGTLTSNSGAIDYLELEDSAVEMVSEQSLEAFSELAQPNTGEQFVQMTGDFAEKAKGFASFAVDKAKMGAQFTAEQLKTGAQVTATYIKENQERQAQEEAEFRATGSYFDGSVLEYIVYSVGVSFLVTITLGLALPWAICIWERWYARHTVIGGRRLYFDGTAMQLFGNWIKWLIFIILTFGIYGWWVNVKIKQWVVKHTHFVD